MTVKTFFHIFLIHLAVCFSAAAQTVRVPAIATTGSPQINSVLNRISCGDINNFYSKLLTLKVVDSGTINIVQIGDSHIQADFFSGEVRKNLQQVFGNAGRGLVFPYQLARSNAPSDIISYSNTGWQYNRLVHPDDNIACGISGFCIQTNRSGASMNVTIQTNENGTQNFNRLQFFMDDNPATAWLFKTEEGDFSDIISNKDSSAFRVLQLPRPANSFSLSLLSTDTTHSFYGVSLQNGQPGIVYHTIGVNGARYDQYNNTPLFWRQLPALKADLYIISLGTNEAQAGSLDEIAFIKQVELFLQQLKSVSPKASVLITTAADSYKGKRSNMVLQQLNTALFRYCSSSHIAFWDLYRVTNGYGSARNWIKKGLMANDRIHFKPKGYQVMGQLLLNAMLTGYNNYVNTY